MTEIKSAVEFWNAGSASLFEFCIEAANIVGRRVDGETQELARCIRRSPDTVERYAKAGLLWWAMLDKYPAESECMRESLDWQYWTTIAPLWARNIISLAGVKDWFDLVVTHNWTHEQYSAKLPTKKALDTEWQKTAYKAALMLDDLRNSPAFGVDDVRYRAGIRIIEIAAIWLKGMTMKNIIDVLIEEKIADNVFRASHIANGCRLFDLKTDVEKIARARLYRDWRNSGIFGKQTQPCYNKAIAGEAVPVDEMFDGALLSRQGVAE